MTVRVYRSSDASAPVLRGNTPGDLINVLDKCLVTGYGSKTAAGWTKPYTGTNIAAFRTGAGSNSMYLRIDDTSTSAGNRHARVVAYETMSGVNTGAPSPFPTAVQFSGGLYWHTMASGSTPANPREWMIIADEKFFWLFINTWPESSSTYANYYYKEAYAFGDIITYKTGDAMHTILLGSTSSTPNTSEGRPFTSVDVGSVQSGLYMARKFDQLGGPQQMGWHTDHQKGSTSWCNGKLSYPHGPDGGLYLAPVWIHETFTSPYSVRGVMPGVWVPCHNVGAVVSEDTFDGQGDLTGRTFMARRHYQYTAVFETSDTWR